MKLIAVCDTCRHQHTIDFDPVAGPGSAFSDWLTKHPMHEIDFFYPQRSGKDHAVPHRYMNYLHNADIKIAYTASAAITITLASLAASATLLAGRESTAVDNGASNKLLDDLLAGFFKTAASNQQVGSINVAVVGNIDDTPTWPDVFDGTDSTETVSQQSIYDQCCKLAAQITTVASASITYWFGPTAIAPLFGGPMPDQYVVFVSQSAETSTNAWSATEGDHGVKRTGVYCTVV